MNGTDSIGASSSTNNNENKVNKSNDAMGKDEFLKLLMTQLKYQDPLEPMDDKEFIAQMAQFSSLEQMQNLNSTMSDFVRYQSLSQVSNFVGKEVAVLNSSTGENVVGEVERVIVSDEGHKVVVEGEEYPLINIQEVLS
ncbi:flagellar hook assembly protein FlgD [Halonatronum saccharophilum]|uniref:flagellar hook assembly protein FlgD n=1 Tax=Halonatronum saccharophilum TaxID=150060 RepID=UPI00048A08C2|nr:flagellar hook assembly protein FlgD [Halonatronum saccharophilum]